VNSRALSSRTIIPPMWKALPTHFAAFRKSSVISATGSAEGRPTGPRPSDGWYPFAADLAYKLVGVGGIFIEGRGRSVNMSSSGILIATETALPLGALIEVQIAWPAKLDDNVSVNLHVRGRTLRSNENHTAVAITGYAFRTRRQNPSPVQRWCLYRGKLVVQDYVQQRAVNFEPTVVVDEP
jgi:hypothetical protein